jgi:hypothetical protein
MCKRSNIYALTCQFSQSQYIPSFVSAIPTSYAGHKTALRLPTSMAPPEIRAGQLLTFMAANVYAQMMVTVTESMSR